MVIEEEKAQSSLIIVCFVALVLSGSFTYFFSEHNILNQWVYLTHALIGLVFSPAIIVYVFLHFKRTLGQRRPLLILSGLFAFIILLLVCWTGLDIVYRGQTETTQWLYSLHIYISLAACVLIIFHVISHRLFLSIRRKQAEKEKFPGVSKHVVRYVVLWIAGICVSIATLSFLYMLMAPDYSDQPEVTPYEYTYGEHPFRPSQTEISSGKFIDSRQIVGSTACGDCHKEITRQWASSAHSHSASDKSYVTNVSLLEKKVGMSATRYCEGCHAPVALLTGQLTEGGKHGGISGTDAFNEGVGCLSCHNIERVIHEKGVASFLYDPHQDYLFASEKHGLGKTIHNFLLRIKPEQHKRDMNRSVLDKPKMCATCHAQFMDKDMNNWGWIKMQDEYTAWLESPYSKQSEQSFSQRDIKRCHDCHMNMVEDNEDPSANEQNLVLSHRFLGANTVIPLLDNDVEHLLLTRQFLQENKMRITIEEPRRKDAIQSSKFIDESLRTITEAPFYFYLNESVDLNVVVTNTGVGHDFPGGTIDINEAWVAITVTDAQGNIVFQSGELDDEKNVDPGSYFYRSIAIDRKGEQVWKHDLFNMVGETYRNIVPAGKSDIVKYQISIASWVKSPLTISAVLKYRKLNQRYAKWALKEEFQDVPVIDIARHSLVVPVKEQSLVRKNKNN